MTYRCTVCRNHYRGEPYRRAGIVAICSQECLINLRAKRRPRPRKADNISDATRATVRERDRHRCRFCGQRDGLHEHHIRYRSEGVDHRPENLIVLCFEHHDLVHSNKDRRQPVCLAYIAELNAGRQRFLPEIDREINA